jgi:two-component system aerobic respiration control sensor histidine kinase ArcB
MSFNQVEFNGALPINASDPFSVQNIIRNVPGCVYWKDVNGIYKGCNQEFLNMTGLTLAQVLGKTDHDFCWNQGAAKLRANDKEVIKSGSPMRFEETVQLANGEKLTYTVVKVPLKDNSGKVVGTLGTSMEISLYKKIADKLRQSNEALVKVNELKSQFIQNMEHDIRTPAGGIIQTLEVLLKQIHDVKQRDVIRYCLASAEELINLINVILNFDREQYHNPVMDKAFKLEDIFNTVYRMNYPAAKVKSLNFHYRISDKIPAILICDEFRIKHILLNLIGNAIKFTEKGYVFFDAKCVKHEGKNLLIEFIVQDSGIGIPHDQQQIIFERFVRLEPANKGLHKGSGLGLANVRDYVQQLGGEIRPIQSELGKGTTFSILIPMKESLDQTALVKPSSKPVEEIEWFRGPLSKSKTDAQEKLKLEPKKKVAQKTIKPLQAKTKVLLVEDSLVVQHMTQSMIQSLDCEATIADSAEKALELLKENKYDLILADIGLPKMNGIDMTREIRYQEKKQGASPTPIVGQTANADTENKKKGIGAGMQDMLPKPLSESIILEVLWQYVPSYREAHPTPEKPIERKIQNEHVIDQAMLDKLIPAKDQPEVLAFAKKELPKMLDELKSAYKKKDFKEISFYAHKIRGSFVCIAAMRCEEAAGHLEDYLKEEKKPTMIHVKVLHDILIKEAEKLAQVL